MPTFCSVTPALVPANGDMSQATVVTAPIDLRQRMGTCIFAKATGAPTGSLQLLGSVLTVPPVTGSTDWQPIGSPVSVTAAGTTVIDLQSTGVLWLQLAYTRTSGSGTLAVVLSGKGS